MSEEQAENDRKTRRTTRAWARQRMGGNEPDRDSDRSLCRCGHTRGDHYIYNLWSEPCAEYDEDSCSCISFIFGKSGAVCVCRHGIDEHHFAGTSVGMCDGVMKKLVVCTCGQFDHIEIENTLAFEL